MTVRRVVMPIFDSSVHLITTEAEAKAFIAEHSEVPDDPADWGDMLGFALEVKDATNQSRHLLCVFDGSRNTAIHEATHMAQIKMKYLNLPSKSVGDETLAHFTAWLACEMLAVLESARA